MKTIVYYYSHKGSNRFLAHRISSDLKCEIEEIKPRLNAHLAMIMGLNFGNSKLKTKVEDLSNDKCLHCEAFPIDLFAPAELKDDSSAYMKVHLNDENFKGEIKGIYDAFIQKL